jgi:hypothetical protein
MRKLLLGLFLIAVHPTNLFSITEDSENGTWAERQVLLRNTMEAQLMVRVGDIDNFGFGWPDDFNPFTGRAVRPHTSPWTPPEGEVEGTDRIMVVSSYNGQPPKGEDAYTTGTVRPDNSVQPITFSFDLGEIHVNDAVLQLFVEDLQAPVLGTHFQVEINGRRSAFLENALNFLDQSAPGGRLVTLEIPSELLSEIATGNVTLKIDDPETGAGDGYAIDFAKLLINIRSFKYAGKIQGTVRDQNNQPIRNADVFANGFLAVKTDAEGNYVFPAPPAGVIYLTVSRPDYKRSVSVFELEDQAVATHDFVLEPAPASDLILTLTYSPTPAIAGLEFNCSIVVSNQGSGTATGVLVTNKLSAGLTFQQATPSQGTIVLTGNEIVADFGIIGPGETALLAVVAIPQKAGIAILDAVAISAEPDKFIGDNAQTEQIEIIDPPVTIAPKLLDLKYSAGIVTFTLSGEAGRSYRIEGTHDLKTWEPLLTVLGTEASVPVVDETGGGGSEQFYRAVQVR